MEEEERVDKSLLGKYADLMEEGSANFTMSENFKAAKFSGSLSSGNGGVAWAERKYPIVLSFEALVACELTALCRDFQNSSITTSVDMRVLF